MRRAWLFEVSESPSRGYWKQFLISRPYEKSQNWPVVECPPLPRGKVSPSPPSCMLSFLCYDKGNEKSLVIWSVWKPFKRYWKQFHISHPYEQNQNLAVVERDTLPQGKVSPPPSPLPSCINVSCMPAFLCYGKSDWEEPGYLKFLKALQEDTGNNFSYLVPMNIVNICLP